jgi:hypothetical protein
VTETHTTQTQTQTQTRMSLAVLDEAEAEARCRRSLAQCPGQWDSPEAWLVQSDSIDEEVSVAAMV